MLVLHPLLQFFNSTRCFLFHCPTFICYIISFFSHRFLQWDHGTIYHTVPCKKKKKTKRKTTATSSFRFGLKKDRYQRHVFYNKMWTCLSITVLGKYLSSTNTPVWFSLLGAGEHVLAGAWHGAIFFSKCSLQGLPLYKTFTTCEIFCSPYGGFC